MSYKNFENLSDAAVGAELAAPHHEIVNANVIAVNKNTNLFDMESYEDGKRRKTGTYSTNSVDDFVRFIKDESTPENCKIFVDDEDMQATAILNYGHEGFEQGKLDYRSVLKLRKTPVFTKLSHAHSIQMSQRDFVDFLIDYAPIFTAVNAQGADIDMGIAINQLRQIKIDETKNTQSEVQNFGETRSTFENVKARTVDDNMPVMFEVNDACYQSLPKTEITLRLVIKSQDGKPYFKLMINGLDLLLIERAEAFVKMVNDGLAGEFDVMLGSFSA